MSSTIADDIPTPEQQRPTTADQISESTPTTNQDQPIQSCTDQSTTATESPPLDQILEALGSVIPVVQDSSSEVDGGEKVDMHEEAYLEMKKKKLEDLKTELTTRTPERVGAFENTEKENIVLQFVENFNRQYKFLFQGRKTLLMSPLNEFGVKKFVCTTIRPSQLPYKELYDYTGCARFVSDFMTYIPLNPVHDIPEVVPSPTYTLKTQQGNCFDLSILLCSLLKGVGYDAYVVSGYATNEITLMDESRSDIGEMELMAKALGFHSQFKGDGNFWMVGEEIEGAAKAEGVEVVDGKSKYKIRPQKSLVSSFIQKSELKKLDAVSKAELAKKEELKKQAEISEEEEDDLKGLRVHAWVLVLPGKREVADAFFIETSTGKTYSTDNINYLGIESVFNSANYWVNMQTCYDGVTGLSLDLGDNTKWEFVLLDNFQTGAAKLEQFEDEDEEENNTEVLDLPRSWVSPIMIKKEDFQIRCPSGTKTILFKNARLEMFAEYHRDDGMVARISLFSNEAEKFHGEIKELFKNRKDKLWKRINSPYHEKIHEFFEPGRPHGLKDHIIIEGGTKEMHYYPSARSDGLVKRVEELNKCIEYFVSRDDRLIYRSESYVMEGDQKVVLKLTEKFERNSEIPASEDFAKKTCFLKEEKIRVVYHVEPGKIIPSYKEFKKPTAEQKGNFTDLSDGFEIDPYAPTPTKQHLYTILHTLVRGEQACLNAIKMSDREMKDILRMRDSEEKNISLTISVYDTIRNSTLPGDEEKESHKSEQEETKTADLDYLSPFLIAKTSPSEKLTKDESIQIREACLKSMKERLVDRANIIQTRLDESSMEYQRRQLAYSRNVDTMTSEETDEYVKFCNNALFKIHILEKRFAKHKEAAPERYMQLDARLKKDKRLIE